MIVIVYSFDGLALGEFPGICGDAFFEIAGSDEIGIGNGDCPVAVVIITGGLIVIDIAWIFYR